MVEIRDPNIKDQTNPENKISDRIIDFLSEIRINIEQFDILGTESWRDKMQTARNQRQGIKRVTNVPYPGAPDIPLPETDKIIRKHKPNFVLSATSGKNFMSVIPAEGLQEVNDVLKQKARKAELLMNHLFQERIPWVKRLTLAADRFLEKGLVNFKIIEKFSSRIISHTIELKEFEKEDLEAFKGLEKEDKVDFLVDRYGFDLEIDEDKNTVDRILNEIASGKEIIQFDTEEVTSLPDVVIPSPEKVYVPKGTTDIANALRITHEFFLTEHELLDKALKGIYIKDKILKLFRDKQGSKNLKTGDRDLNEKLKDRLAGVDDNEEVGEYYRIHEVYTWYQPKENEPFERWVFTYLADVGDTEDSLIQFMPYPFEADGWNWIRHDNEIVDENHYRSRGIPEQIRALQEFMERANNNILIRDEINNSPMFTVLANSKIRSNNIRFIPGQRITVNSHDEIRPLIESRNVDVSSERISQTLKAFAEEYIGNVDQLFRNATNAGGGKTLGEVKTGIAVSQFVLNLDIMNWLDTLSKVYTMVFNVLSERLTGIYFINGEKITREDFQFVPSIRPNGSIDEADKQFQAQKSLARLQIIRQAKMDGVATLEDVYNAYRDYIEKDGVNNPDEVLTDPKVILQEQITQMEQRALQNNQLILQQNQILEQGEMALDRTQQELKKAAV